MSSSGGASTGGSSSLIARLVQQLSRLPGIGEKTATRLAFHILRGSPEDAGALAEAITALRGRIHLCQRCCDFTESDPCRLCADARRDASLVCVVAQPQDVVALDRAVGYAGLFHVLHGVLSPLDGIGPDELRVTELVRRCGDGTVKEVILATNPSVEGETTAVYLAKLLRPLGVRTTRIATGMPVGGELEYADRFTLTRALDNRRDM